MALPRKSIARCAQYLVCSAYSTVHTTNLCLGIKDVSCSPLSDNGQPQQSLYYFFWLQSAATSRPSPRPAVCLPVCMHAWLRRAISPILIQLCQQFAYLTIRLFSWRNHRSHRCPFVDSAIDRFLYIFFFLLRPIPAKTFTL